MASRELCCQCSACLMPGREQCFSSPGDTGRLLFSFARTVWVSMLSHLYISFKPTSQQKVKALLQTTLSRGESRDTNENRLCTMEVKNCSKRTANRRVLQDIKYGGKWSCLALNPPPVQKPGRVMCGIS